MLVMAAVEEVREHAERETGHAQWARVMHWGGRVVLQWRVKAVQRWARVLQWMARKALWRVKTV